MQFKYKWRGGGRQNTDSHIISPHNMFLRAHTNINMFHRHKYETQHLASVDNRNKAQTTTTKSHSLVVTLQLLQHILTFCILLGITTDVGLFQKLDFHKTIINFLLLLLYETIPFHGHNITFFD